jgi:hypothetical protein
VDAKRLAHDLFQCSGRNRAAQRDQRDLAGLGRNVPFFFPMHRSDVAWKTCFWLSRTRRASSGCATAAILRHETALRRLPGEVWGGELLADVQAGRSSGPSPVGPVTPEGGIPAHPLRSKGADPECGAGFVQPTKC